MEQTVEPLVSVVVPIRNEEAYVTKCLDALLEQDYPSNRVEILCIDGMSDDGTRSRILRYSQEYPNIRLLDNPNQIAPSALNVGIRAAQGDIIIRVDARCIVAPDYVRQCIYYLQKTGAQNVGGPQVAVGEDEPVPRAIATAITSIFGMGNSKFRYATQEQYVDTVYLGAYPREIFERIGLYNESLLRNQDFEFNHRIIKAGGKIFFTPNIRSIYYGRPTLQKLWKQYFQYGYWKVRTLRLHPESLKIRQVVAPLFVLSLMIGLCLSLLMGTHWPLVLIIGVYGGVSLLVSLSLWRTRKLGVAAFLLPIVFAILHIGWGAGFLWGAMTLVFPPQHVPGSGY